MIDRQTALVDMGMADESSKAARYRGRVAVTGATGFVARHLMDRLIRDGYQVRALSRSGTGRQDVEDCPVDYADSHALQVALQHVDTVFHLAARAHQLGESAQGADVQENYRLANVEATRALALAAISAGVRRFVFLSSIGVNGNHTTGGPFTPHDVPLPIEPYAKSKLEAEEVVKSLLAQGSSDYVILRPPLVYGPGCPGNFASLLRLVERAPLLPVGGLRAPRTFIGIHNLVDALVVAATATAVARRTYLLADARDTSVSEIVRVLARGMGKPRWSVLDVPAGWLGCLAAMAGKQNAWRKLSAALQVDGSDFCRDAGWCPPYAPVDGLLETARYYIATKSDE
jgi:nucleoside-diphosphate-sugar epimerase